MPTRFRDDDGTEYMIPAHLTSMFRCAVLNIRQSPLIWEGDPPTCHPMYMSRWIAILPKLKSGFHGIFDVYRVPYNGKGRAVKILKRYQKQDEKYRTKH